MRKIHLIFFGLLISVSAFGQAPFIQGTLKLRRNESQIQSPPKIKVYDACGTTHSYLIDSSAFYIRGECAIDSVTFSAKSHFPLTLYPRRKDTLFMELRLVAHYGLPSVNIYSGYSTPPPFPGHLEPNSHVLRPEFIGAAGEASLAPGMNLVAGVQMDERGPGGSRRVSIRGSIQRSPFGVRNLKAYWNGIPFSSADGSTPLEEIDPFFLDYIAVGKGPMGLRFGAGHGGNLQMGSRAGSSHEFRGFENLLADRKVPPGKGPTNQYSGTNRRFRIKNEMGSWGMSRQMGEFEIEHKGFGQKVVYVRQQTNGYREQESNRKQQILLTGHLGRFADSRFEWMVSAFEGAWELPGSLDSAQFMQDPRQANPYSVSARARVERSRYRIGVRSSGLVGPFLQKTALFAYQSSKLNPYGTSPFFQGIKQEEAFGYGGRTDWERVQELTFSEKERGSLHIQFGMEYLADRNQYEEYENLNGGIGNLRNRALLPSEQALSYFDLSYTSERDYKIRSGIGYSGYRFQFQDRLSDSLDQTFQMPWHGSITHRSAFEIYPKNRWLLWVSLSNGLSPPSVWELLDPVSGYNQNLSHETSTQVEFGTSYSGKGVAGISLYWLQVRNAILPQQDSLGRTFFQNVGTTSQPGIEGRYSLSFHYLPKPFEFIQATWTGAWQPYFFQSGSFNGQDLKGNTIPGIPALTSSLNTRIVFPNSLEIQPNLRYVGQINLNQTGTDRQPGRFTADLVGRYFLSLGKFSNLYSNLEFEVGVRNLFNAQYSSFPTLNAFGGRYYNPAPGRWFFFSLTLKGFSES